MAIIYSNRNDNVGFLVTKNFNDPTTWLGGIVPGAADQVYIVGRRTTINQANIDYWVGTRTITVGSTSNFATTGFFYTVTQDSQLVKVTYTGKTSTQFTGCQIDNSDPYYTFNVLGVRSNIANGAYVHNPAYVVTVPTGTTFECLELIIQEGGIILIEGTGQLILNQGVLVRDGKFFAKDYANIIIQRPSSALSSGTIGYFTSQNWQLSIVDIEGIENRAYTTLAVDAPVGSTYLKLDLPIQNGTLAAGDDISVSSYNTWKYAKYNFYNDYSYGTEFTNIDGGYDAVDLIGDKLYIALRNGVKGEIKTLSRDATTNQLIVEVACDNINFNVGDIVLSEVLGTGDYGSYTIDYIEDGAYTLAEYDFTNPATSLADFWVNDPTMSYSNGWVIQSGVGLRNTAGSYREFIHKYHFERDIIVEADMSPLDGYSTGSRGTAAYGIMTTYDPAYRSGHRGYDQMKSDYFVIDDSQDRIYFHMYSTTVDQNCRLSYNPTLRNTTRGPATYTVVCRDSKDYVYINGELFTSDFRRDGNYKGLCGLYTNGNANFRCRRLKISAPTQKLYITTTDDLIVGNTIYRSGTEVAHVAGQRVLKIASINTGNGSHQDLLFAYRGQNGSGIWPVGRGVNANVSSNSNFPYIHNHDANQDYYMPLTTTTSPQYVVFDLTQATTFTHVSFVPRTTDISNVYGYNGVAIYGSNDGTTWTTLYGPTNDTKYFYYLSYGRMAFYPTGTVTYRYLKFETRGTQTSTTYNRYVNIGVHDFSSGYTLDLNNASDFNIGDTISVLTDSNFSPFTTDYEAYFALIQSGTGSNPETYFHGGWMPEVTIINKVGNLLYLDKPIWWGYIEDSDSVTVVKTNRTLNISGRITIGSSSQTDWRFPNIVSDNGLQNGRQLLFKYARFQYIGGNRYSGSGSFNRGITFNLTNYYNSILMDGCSFVMGSLTNQYTGIINYQGSMVFRNNFASVLGAMMPAYYTSAFMGQLICNNKFQNANRPLHSEGGENFIINYNETSASDYGIFITALRHVRQSISQYSEIKRNYMKGTSNSGLYSPIEVGGALPSTYVDISDNKIRAMDDLSHVSNYNTYSPIKNANSFAEHTGSRLSRYRNEGHFSMADVATESSIQTVHQNYGRHGYDLSYNSNLYYEKNPQYNFIRMYPAYSDGFLPGWQAIEFDVLEDGAIFEVEVMVEYKYSPLARLQADGINLGQMRFMAIQNAQRVEIQYGAVPSTLTDNYAVFTYTFSLFQPIKGPCGVMWSRFGRASYIDIKSSYANVLVQNDKKIYVRGNTFNLNNLFDQYSLQTSKKNPNAASTASLNIIKLKV
jgi:hypothetical protein